MSKLARDSAGFSAALARQNTTTWHSKNTPGQPERPPVPLFNETPAEAETSGSKKKRPKTNVVYSQPADTGVRANINTQLVYAVNHLKSTPNPMRLQDISFVTNTPLESDSVLLEKFRTHDRIHWDKRTDLYSYKHDYNFRSKAALLVEIQRQTRKGGGISVRTLKESWKEAPAAIEELEAEGDVLVMRTAKDGTPKTVFWNEIKPTEESGGLPVEKEFYDLWHSLKTPNDVDLLRSLNNEGLQLTNAETLIPKAPTTKKKKKSAPRLRAPKLSNTHLKDIDLTQDYAPVK